MPVHTMKKMNRKPAGTVGGLLAGAAIGYGAAKYMQSRTSSTPGKTGEGAVNKAPAPRPKPKKGKAVAKKTAPKPKASMKKKDMPKSAYDNLYKSLPTSNDPSYADQTPATREHRRKVIKQVLGMAKEYDSYPSGTRERKYIGTKLKTTLGKMKGLEGKKGTKWSRKMER